VRKHDHEGVTVEGGYSCARAAGVWKVVAVRELKRTRPSDRQIRPACQQDSRVLDRKPEHEKRTKSAAHRHEWCTNKRQKGIRSFLKSIRAAVRSRQGARFPVPREILKLMRRRGH